MPRDTAPHDVTSELPLGDVAATTAVEVPGSPEALLLGALDWAARGFRVFPLVPDGKVPAFPGWQQSATSDPEIIRAMWTERTAIDPVTGAVVDRVMPYNIGYVTDDLVVIDIDVKKDTNARDIYQTELLGDFDTLEIRTTNDGTHLIYSRPERDRATRVNLEELPIDIKAVGGLAVAPGSVVEGRFYTLVADRSVKPAPAHLVGRIPQARDRGQKTGTALVDLDRPSTIEWATRLVQSYAPALKGGRGIACYRLAALLRDYGLSADTAARLIDEFWSPRCDPAFPAEDGRDEDGPVEGSLTAVAHAYEHAQNDPGAKSAEATLSGVKLRSAPPAPPPAAGMAVGGNGLQLASPVKPVLDLMFTDKGALIPNQANGLTIVRNRHRFANRYRYNEFSATPEIYPDATPIDDVEVAQVQEYFQREEGMPRIGQQLIREVLLQRAYETRHHPVKDYLGRCREEWDGKPRLSTWMHTYLGAEQSDYTAAVGTMWTISAVARIFRPGCKADHALVLPGAQGSFKSTVPAILGDEWFSDNVGDIKSKDASILVRDRWIIEIGELAAVNRDLETVKAWMTRTHENFRPPFGRLPVKEPRQCVFIATTNAATFLRDPTGNRRWWPVSVDEIDTTALARDRGQLFGEAVHLLDAGQPWWPQQAFERDVIAPRQEERFEVDAWEDPILAALHDLAQRPRSGPTPWPRARTTVPDIARLALGLTTDRLDTSPTRRIAAILSRAGWKPGRTESGRFWELPSGWTEPSPLPPALAAVAPKEAV